MSDANARTNLFSRRLILERVGAGWPPAQVAEQLGVSRSTVYKWLRRYAEGGEAALADRSSQPHRMPQKTLDHVERKVLAARRRLKRGAVVLAAELGLNPSTVGRILARHQVPHLSAIDPITAESVRSSRRSPNRYEHRIPGSLIHVDVKKLGRIPKGGGWRLHGRAAEISVANRHKKTKIGYDYVHTAIDDRIRLAYSEVLPNEKDLTCAEFLHYALSWFADHGVRVRRVLTDNALVYRHGTHWGWVCSAWQVRRRFIKPGCPWTNGKAERFNRTLLAEWAYAQAWNPTANANAASTDSSTGTTLDEATLPSEENHPSADLPPDNNVSGHDT